MALHVYVGTGVSELAGYDVAAAAAAELIIESEETWDSPLTRCPVQKAAHSKLPRRSRRGPERDTPTDAGCGRAQLRGSAVRLRPCKWPTPASGRVANQPTPGTVKRSVQAVTTRAPGEVAVVIEPAPTRDVRIGCPWFPARHFVRSVRIRRI